MKNLIALSPVHGRQQQSEKSIPQFITELSRFNAKWNVPEEFRADVIAVYGEDIYAEIVAEQCSLTLTKPDDDWLSKFRKFTKRKISYGKLKVCMKKIFSSNVPILKVLKPEFLIKSPTSKVLIHWI
jgi:hypothetical protein